MEPESTNISASSHIKLGSPLEAQISRLIWTHFYSLVSMQGREKFLLEKGDWGMGKIAFTEWGELEQAGVRHEFINM